MYSSIHQPANACYVQPLQRHWHWAHATNLMHGNTPHRSFWPWKALTSAYKLSDQTKRPGWIFAALNLIPSGIWIQVQIRRWKLTCRRFYRMVMHCAWPLDLRMCYLRAHVWAPTHNCLSSVLKTRFKLWDETREETGCSCGEICILWDFLSYVVMFLLYRIIYHEIL
jgi:hypothetical protein